jgi:hypothetical protein
MPRWSYDLSRVVPYDFPTPSDEYDDTLVYVQQKFNSGSLDIVDTIDNYGITRWDGEQVREEIKDHMDKRVRYSEIHKRLTMR